MDNESLLCDFFLVNHVYNCVIVIHANDEYCVVRIMRCLDVSMMCGSDVGTTWLLLLFMIGIEIIN